MGGAPGCESGRPLLRRPEGSLPIATDGDNTERGGPNWHLVNNGQFVTLEGQGYVAVRWNVEYRARAGEITSPSFASSGEFFRVGGGGMMRLDEEQPGTTGNWLGNAEEGESYVPDGGEVPWQNEFYYLDGQVTITNEETEGLYNIAVYPQTYEEVTSEGWGLYSPGEVCDY